METEKMGKWRCFLDSLATDGGHIFILFTTICLGVVVYRWLDATAGGQIITLSFGALLALTKGGGTNREQMTPPPQSTTSIASVTTVPSAPPAPNP